MWPGLGVVWGALRGDIMSGGLAPQPAEVLLKASRVTRYLRGHRGRAVRSATESDNVERWHLSKRLSRIRPQVDLQSPTLEPQAEARLAEGTEEPG